MKRSQDRHPCRFSTGDWRRLAKRRPIWKKKILIGGWRVWTLGSRMTPQSPRETAWQRSGRKGAKIQRLWTSSQKRPSSTNARWLLKGGLSKSGKFESKKVGPGGKPDPAWLPLPFPVKSKRNLQRHKALLIPVYG